MRLKRKFFGLRQHYFRSQNDAKNATYLQQDYTHTTVDNNIFSSFRRKVIAERVVLGKIKAIILGKIYPSNLKPRNLSLLVHTSIANRW